MQHALKLTAREKTNVWLDLCDFTFKLLKSNLSAKGLSRRFRKIRQDHLEEDYLILSRLSKNKK